MFDTEDDLWLNALECTAPSEMTEEEHDARIIDSAEEEMYARLEG